MKKRSIVLMTVLIIAAVLAVVLFWPQDDLKHLKKTEEVPQETEAAMEIVNHFVEAAAKNDLKTVASYLYVRDHIVIALVRVITIAVAGVQEHCIF